MSESDTLFAVYRGDTIIGVGTRREMAKCLGITPKSLSHLAAPAHLKRNKSGLRAYRIRKEDLEDED